MPPPIGFFDWLTSQIQRNDSVGNFARYAIKDKLFPRHGRRLYIFLLRYEGLPELRNLAKKAHAEWRREILRLRQNPSQLSQLSQTSKSQINSSNHE